MLPWVRESRRLLLDPLCTTECEALIALVLELQDLCSPRATKELMTAATAHVEGLFKEQLSRICLPLLKLCAPQNREVVQTDNTTGTPALARAYTEQ